MNSQRSTSSAGAGKQQGHLGLSWTARRWGCACSTGSRDNGRQRQVTPQPSPRHTLHTTWTQQYLQHQLGLVLDITWPNVRPSPLQRNTLISSEPVSPRSSTALYTLLQQWYLLCSLQKLIVFIPCTKIHQCTCTAGQSSWLFNALLLPKRTTAKKLTPYWEGR